MDKKIKDVAVRSIIAILTVYCLLLVLFPLGWLVLLGGAILHPETIRKMLGYKIPSTKIQDKLER